MRSLSACSMRVLCCEECWVHEWLWWGDSTTTSWCPRACQRTKPVTSSSTSPDAEPVRTGKRLGITRTAHWASPFWSGKDQQAAAGGVKCSLPGQKGQRLSLSCSWGRRPRRVARIVHSPVRGFLRSSARAAPFRRREAAGCGFSSLAGGQRNYW